MDGNTTAVRRLIDALHERMVRRHPARPRQRLGYRRLFILPTRSGLFFLSLGALIFVLSVNYILSLGLALAFFMFSLFMASILQTFRNLHGIEVIAGRGPEQPVFVGQEASFPVTLRVPRGSTANAISLRLGRQGTPRITNPGRDRDSVRLSVTAARRGRLSVPPLRLESEYPTGLCRVWSDLDLSLQCLVCPEPVPPPEPAPSRGRRSGPDGGVVERQTPGTEQFQDLRTYRSGDSLSRIAWKSLAGRRGLQVKQFTDEAGSERMFRWDDFPGIETELRLSWMCYLVLEADKEGVFYGLLLPGTVIVPARGESHHRRVMEALALFEPGGGS